MRQLLIKGKKINVTEVLNTVLYELQLSTEIEDIHTIKAKAINVSCKPFKKEDLEEGVIEARLSTGHSYIFKTFDNGKLVTTWLAAWEMDYRYETKPSETKFLGYTVYNTETNTCYFDKNHHKHS